MRFWEVLAPWVFGISGAITLSLLEALFSPHTVLRRYFGEQTDAPGLLAIVRNWGAGIAACGGLLLAAAFLPDLRVATAVFAIATKAVFVALVLVPGRPAARRPAYLAVGFDLAVIAVLIGYLASASG